PRLMTGFRTLPREPYQKGRSGPSDPPRTEPWLDRTTGPSLVETRRADSGLRRAAGGPRAGDAPRAPYGRTYGRGPGAPRRGAAASQRSRKDGPLLVPHARRRRGRLGSQGALGGRGA